MCFKYFSFTTKTDWREFVKSPPILHFSYITTEREPFDSLSFKKILLSFRSFTLSFFLQIQYTPQSVGAVRLFILSLHLKAVSHTPDSFNILWFCSIKFDFFTNLLNMYCNCGNISYGFHIPYFVK